MHSLNTSVIASILIKNMIPVTIILTTIIIRIRMLMMVVVIMMDSIYRAKLFMTQFVLTFYKRKKQCQKITKFLFSIDIHLMYCVFKV